MPTDLTPRAPPGVERRWSFGPAVFDERTMELRLSGEPVAIERKALQLLMHLLRHAGEVVTKDELQAAAWPGCSLSDSVLTKCMARLREALHDESQGLVKTVHGFGYRLIAPVSVATDATPVSPRFEFHAGERLPSRPLWSLVERLGTGGYGEAWLARQDRTGEQRVYKFAVDEGGLTALKREITIYRLLHDTLGERPDLTRLLEWNVEEPPYFLEYEHVAGGSLSAWAMERGGIDRVPLAERLDIAAQVAGALAAAHSVGVLHKDLKPSNILLEPGAGAAPRVRLCDFGSGGILDVRRLDQLGITRLGFTRTLAQGGAPATPLYLAPEVLAGQPFTVRADVYAVGVILYQLAVGNLQKPIASGWEQDVPDEVLRSDIALAVDGEPARRIADAGDLAQRLRSLDRRREELARGRAAQAAVKQTGLEMERAIARRKWVRLTIAALLAGVAVSSALYVEARRARDEAAASAASVRAVNDFLTQDMFAQISSGRPLRSLTVKEVLDGASTQVDARFAGQPAVAAMIHASLGSSYVGLDEAAAAERELDRALSEETPRNRAASAGARVGPRKHPLIEREAGVGHDRQRQHQQRQEQDRHHDDAGQQQPPGDGGGKVAQHHAHARIHGVDQRRSALMQQRHGERRQCEGEERQHRTHERTPQREGGTVRLQLAQPQRLARRVEPADHEAVEDPGVGDPDHEQEGAQQRDHPQAQRRVAEPGQRVARARVPAGGVDLREAEEAGEQDRPEQHEAGGEGQGHGRQSEAVDAQQHRDPGDHGDRAERQADAGQRAERRPALAHGRREVAEGEAAPGWFWSRQWHARSPGRMCAPS